MSGTKVAIIPGNGAGNVEDCNWYASVRDELKKAGLKAVLKNMPDPVSAREKVWIPFMHDKLKCDKNTVIIGHSSGAEAAMRYAEDHPVKGIVLVSAYHTDLGEEGEKIAGYFDRPWEWAKIRDNAEFIIQFGSTDDPFVPFSEQQEVANQLKADFIKHSDKGHYLEFEFDELVSVLKSKLAL